MIKIYGIKNCDTIKKTLKMLDSEEIGYVFHDYKKQTPSRELLSEMIQALGLDTVVNKRGTTFRKLDESQKGALDSQESAIPVLKENSSMIKRPIIQLENGTWIAGYDASLPEQVKGAR
ncbi:Spx/MgsR family RNA polymerase-binding regulatory protein [Litoribacter alkaliphilus]|uniref:Spx/MgsR family RNA polymerase-binding regulatory protein n=1 Tax=Litoribacter ruber TaxID=702568 RepID=A0AAP2G2U1_9BACT|nr:Spx/MgsR family RNA polymerase-binding regulatory protein [Litoribacter alkaliphilus]MBS9522695.1 Spx/MgsR family RNA polymerase-binding regulatory protein [Litoribacter alkaliphilus]